MLDPGSDLAGKRILLVSDDAKLSRAIELNLSNPSRMVVVGPDDTQLGKRAWAPEMGGIDLLVVAASSPASEPLVLLAQASLTDQIGQVPLLIISDRPFSVVPGTKIGHLSFPFCPGELHRSVREILLGTLSGVAASSTC